ncbi:hypothetical protein CONCODRAFT_13508 [Conidiobolus coronatus NRRL 28638]|uniref:Uncharacterized protein n=1 Tax=Conidiobolus coronatus (strain ATCC 28846 / CBS 209.66 / NRRL 28638) TaxID=796925 RepID=A0A137NQQ7_CONC2|nr:hypothetical protein CONCODRAFT_13508 [Conidiobolus coronatus NRRL 28638]|eukprot:KXN65044.1 hypothetical protein CONCODRAFT_13508 [Conidiobolus coronatus NRRL 28638]
MTNPLIRKIEEELTVVDQELGQLNQLIATAELAAQPGNYQQLSQLLFQIQTYAQPPNMSNRRSELSNWNKDRQPSK